MNVVSSARKLIFQPEAGAPVAKFPHGAKVNAYGTNNMSPTIVVRNGTEKEPSWQGVDHDSGVVIVNEVPEQAANTALDIFENGGKTNDALRLALYYLASSGFNDQYTTNFDFVINKLVTDGRMVEKFTGIFKRNFKDLTPCWRENGKFWTAHYGQAHVIEPDILLQTYQNEDGSDINLETVPDGRPEDVEV